MPKKQRPDDVWLVTVTAQRGDRAVETTFALSEEQYLQFDRMVRQFLDDKPFLTCCPQVPQARGAAAEVTETAVAPSSPPGPTRVVNVIRLKR